MIDKLPQTAIDNLKRASHSSDNIRSECNRKWMISRLRPNFGNIEFEDHYTRDFHLDFGDILGIGVQNFLIADDIDAAFWQMFINWGVVLDSEDGMEKKKSFWHAMQGIEKFQLFRQTDLMNLELINLNGQPAIEVGFKIHFNAGYTYVGYIDAILWNNIQERLVPMENKSEGGYRSPHEARYKNQGQGIGYKLVVDAISRRLDIQQSEDYDILYCVYNTTKEEWFRFDFTKSSKVLAKWIKTQLANQSSVTAMIQNNFFPMNGNSCFNFFRPCKYYGLCEADDYMLFGPGYNKITPKKDKEGMIMFEFQIDEIVDTLMEKV